MKTPDRTQNVAEMQVDLLPTELLVLVMLANIGHAMLAGDKEAVTALGNMLMELPDSEPTAMAALQKLEASMKLAASIANGGGLS